MISNINNCSLKT